MTIEAVLTVTALIALFGLALVGMRVLTAESALDEATRSAARAASLARDGQAAAVTAELHAQTVISAQHLTCFGLRVDVDARDFAKPLGDNGYVTATITCTVPLGELGLPGINGSKVLSSTFRSPIDRYGARP